MVNMLKDVRGNKHEGNGENKTKMKLLEMKSIGSEIRNTLTGFNSRLDTQKVKISKTEDMTIETVQNKTH